MANTYEINEWVKIPKFAGTENEHARVIAVYEDLECVTVANMNMPFSGTFSSETFKFEDVRKWND